MASLLLIVAAASARGDWENRFSKGETFQRAGRYMEAATEFEAALKIVQRDNPADVKVAVTNNNLGVVYRVLGRTHEAERCYMAAIAFYEKRPDLAASLATTLENLAVLDLNIGLLSKAAPLYLRSYQLRVAVLPAGAPAIGQSLQGLARLEQERHHFKQSEAYYRQALAIQEAAPTLHNLATLLTEDGRFEEARPLYERALAIYRSSSPDHPDAAVVLRHLADLDAHDGLRAAAEEKYREAISICERALPAGHPQTGIVLQAYGQFLNRNGRSKEGASLMKRSNEILAKGMRDTGEAYRIDARLLAGN